MEGLTSFHACSVYFHNFRCLGHVASDPTVMISHMRTTTADTSDTEEALMMITMTQVDHDAPDLAAGGMFYLLLN